VCVCVGSILYQGLINSQKGEDWREVESVQCREGKTDCKKWNGVKKKEAG